MTTKPIWILVCVVALAGMFSGCQSSKIAFGNSYYFKQTPKAVAQQPATVDKVAPNSAELQVSTKPQALAQRDASVLLEQAQAQLLAEVEKTDSEALKESAQRFNETVNSMKGQQLTKKETRAKRKELRKELRTLAKEYKAAAPNETQDMDKQALLAIIFGGAGLIFIFLFWPLGILLILASLVLLIIWAANS